MKLTQLLPIILATVTIGLFGTVTASQVKEPSSIKIIVKAPAEELELFCASQKYPELAVHIATFLNRNYKEADLSICKVAAHLLKVTRKNIIDCFQYNTDLEIDKLTKTQREALQLLNALVKDKNTTYNEYSIQAYENLYLAFNSSNIPTSVNLFWPIQDRLFQHYQNRFFKKHIFYFEKFAQYLKENYTTEEADALTRLFIKGLQDHPEVFSFGGRREALAKCGPPLSEISGWARFEPEQKAALGEEQQATVQEAAENLKKQAAEEKEKTVTAQQGPAPKIAHADHAPLDESNRAITQATQDSNSQNSNRDALDNFVNEQGIEPGEVISGKIPAQTPIPSAFDKNDVFTRAKRFLGENRWAKYTAYALGAVAVLYGGYRFSKYLNTRKLVPSVGRWA